MTIQKSLTIRADAHSLHFLIEEQGQDPVHHPYPFHDNMSVAANLRLAIKEEEWLQGPFERVLLMLNAPCMLIPRTEYLASPDYDLNTAYSSVFPSSATTDIRLDSIDDLGAMSAYAVNSDLMMVVSDNYPSFITLNIITPIWQHLYHSYYHQGDHRKLFAYFHDGLLHLCSFGNRHIVYANSFEATNSHDALYYIMLVWRELGYDPSRDHLIMATCPFADDFLTEHLAANVNNVKHINPTLELQRSPRARLHDMPFDMMI